MTETGHESKATVLKRLFEGDIQAFLSHYPTRPFHHWGALDRMPSEIAELSVEKLSQICRGDLSLHAHDSRPVTVHRPDPDLTRWLLQRSAGMTFGNIENGLPELSGWCSELAKELCLPEHVRRPRCNAFCSPRSGGYQFHFHYEGALLVQVQGRKSIRLAPVASPFPVVQTDTNQAFEEGFSVEPRSMATYAQFAAKGFPVPPEEALTEKLELEPGSTVFIPPGYWHATRTLDERSLAFSVFIETPRLYEGFLRGLELRLLTESAWRRPVAATGPQAVTEDDLEKMQARLVEVARSLRKEDVRLGWGSRGPITKTVTLFPNPDVRWSARPQEGGVTFAIECHQGYEFEVEEPIAEVIRRLLMRKLPFDMETILRESGSESYDAVSAAIELLEEMGVLVRAPFPRPENSRP